MNGWDRFWRGADRARIVIRAMLIIVFWGLFTFAWRATDRFFGIVETAQLEDNPEWAAMVPVLGAVTAFVSVTIKVFADLAKAIWESWAKGGTDWEKLDEDK